MRVLCIDASKNPTSQIAPRFKENELLTAINGEYPDCYKILEYPTDDWKGEHVNSEWLKKRFIPLQDEEPEHEESKLKVIEEDVMAYMRCIELINH